LKEWEPLANQGYAQAQTNLDTMYSHAKGVSRNYPLAAFWHHKAAAQGSARSMYNLGVAYESGRGVEQNDTTALN
jgi:TPR repeat protein